MEGLRGEVWRGVSAPTDGPLEESQVTGSSGGREEQVGVCWGGGLEILDMAKEQAGSDDTSAAQTTGLDSGHNPEISGSES